MDSGYILFSWLPIDHVTSEDSALPLLLSDKNYSLITVLCHPFHACVCFVMPH